MKRQGKLLLTGSSGMVGRNILDQLEIRNWTVTAPSSQELDLTDWSVTRSFLRSIQPDAVIHAAGLVGGIQANVASPFLFLERNLTMGRNIIVASREAGVRHFLNLASTCMYPTNMETTLSEDMILSAPLEPTNEGYALAKIVTTKMCEYITAGDARFSYKTLVPCNLYGCYDKFDPSISHLVPAIITKIHSAQKHGDATVSIWGDGSARREFMYAGDLAEAAMRAIRDIESIPTVMNIGLGMDFSVKEYYETVADVFGWNGVFHFDLSKPAGTKRKLSNVDLQTRWGWRPKTDLRSGIQKTVAYYLGTI